MSRTTLEHSDPTSPPPDPKPAKIPLWCLKLTLRGVLLLVLYAGATTWWLSKASARYRDELDRVSTHSRDLLRYRIANDHYAKTGISQRLGVDLSWGQARTGEITQILGSEPAKRQVSESPADLGSSDSYSVWTIPSTPPATTPDELWVRFDQDGVLAACTFRVLAHGHVFAGGPTFLLRAAEERRAMTLRKLVPPAVLVPLIVVLLANWHARRQRRRAAEERHNRSRQPQLDSLATCPPPD